MNDMLEDDTLITLITKSDDQEVESHTQDDDATRKKKFIFRLVSALHSAGNLSYRTEEYVRQVALSFGLYSSCAVFPVSAMLSFQESGQLNPHSCESYIIPIVAGLDCLKLSLLDQICFDIQQGRVNFDSADKRLLLIEENIQVYPWYITAIAYGLASFSSATLFFGGNWRDGTWAILFGLIVYLVGDLCRRFQGLAEIECFVSSFVVTCIASTLDKYVYNEHLCLYGQLFGGIVWLLPGITITIAVLELYSRMIVYGSSRLIYGISLASQLGFGLTGGYRVIYSDRELPDSFENGCKHSLNPAFGIILLPLASLCFGVLVNANPKQLSGMVLCAAVGQFVSYGVDSLKCLNDDFIPAVAAALVTVSARMYAYARGERPLVYIISGLLVLVPGGMGVRGMSDMWSGDVKSGMEFTFEMVLIGICLAIGVFFALLPRRAWFRSVTTTKAAMRGDVLRTLTDAKTRLFTGFTMYAPPVSVKECDV